jgi:sialate O-acetylesterase
MTLSHPNTGMVVVTDLIDSVSNIHPSRKKPVGERLANWALAETYKKSGIIYKSPQYSSMSKEKDKITLQFSNVPSSLICTGKSITGFFIAGADQAWAAADAKIENNKIIVSSKVVKDPVQVRYGFGNTIIGNIASKEGLPLCPFRTDGWVVDQSLSN